MAQALGLAIDASFLNNLTLADEKIKQLTSSTNALSRSTVNAFSQMTKQGILPYINGLREQVSLFSQIAGLKIKNPTDDIRAMQNAATSTVQSLNQLISALERTGAYQNATSNQSLTNQSQAGLYELKLISDQIKRRQEGEDLIARTEQERHNTRQKQYDEMGERLAKEQRIKEEYGRIEQRQIEQVGANKARWNRQAIEQVQRERAARQKMYEELFRKQAQLQSQDRANNYRHIQGYGDTTNQAMAAYNRLYGGKGVMSINNMENTLAKLRAAQDKINTSTEAGRKKYEQLGNAIKRIEKDLKGIRGETNGIVDSASKWVQRMMAFAAFGAFKGFVNKLVEIRGEFELQQRSLQAIVQDKDKANEVWDKTVALAVKSPFRVKDLVKYTKQLAAYRVESDKLYETNKMLADVSAGLGVDMQRLILAYGQVKAANFLRGTELRQFSEAGVNMLGELSKYFTEIEGKAVSVGEVFERVSKRRVSFGDIDAVFKRITSEGGIFYNMQEKQSQTLKGMVMNLKDSTDLMFNEIGKEQSKVIKGAIKLTRELVDNWRIFKPIVISTGTAFITFFGAATLRKIGAAMASITATNPWIAAASAIGFLAVTLIEASQAQSKFNALMQEVDSEVLSSLRESIALYKELTMTINDATTSNEERTKAYEKLESTFKSILPDMYLEKSYVEALSNDYKAAEEAMYSYYNAKAKEQKRDRVEQEYASELEGTDIPELITSIERRINAIDVNILGSEMIRTKLLGGISGAVNSTVDDIKNGKVDASVKSLTDEINKKLATYAGLSDFNIFENIVGYYNLTEVAVSEDMSDIVKTLEKYVIRMKSINGLFKGTYDEDAAADLILREKEKVEQATEAFKKASGLYEKYVSVVPKEGETVAKQRKKLQDDVDSILKNLPVGMEAYADRLKLSFNAMKTAADEGKFAFGEALQSIEADFYKKETGGIAKIAFDNVHLEETANDAAKTLVTNFQEELDEQGKNLDLSEFQKGVIDGAKFIAKKFGREVDIFADFIPKSEEGLSQMQTKVKTKLEELKTELKQHQVSIAQGAANISLMVLTQTQNQIADIISQIPALEAFSHLLGNFDKKKSSGGDKRMQTLKNQVGLIKEMNGEYEKLLKNMTKEEAKLEVINSYRDSLKSLGLSKLGFDIDKMDFTDLGTIDSLEKLLGDPKYKANKYAIEIRKALDNLKVELKVEAKIEKKEALNKQVADMFDELDLSTELKKLNIGKDVAKALFGIDAKSSEEVRATLEGLKPEFEKLGKDGVDAYNKAFEKLNDFEDKEQIDRLKKYLEYARGAIGERAKIKVEEMTKLQEIDETYTKAMNEAKNEEDKKKIEEQRKLSEEWVKKEANEKIQKKDWEDFKTSDTFVSLFQDLDNASDSLLNHAISKIQEFRKEWKDMPVSDAKEMISKLNELELALLDTGKPFADYRKANEDIKNAMEARGIDAKPKSGKSQKELRERIGDENKEMEAIIANAQIIESVLQTINNATGENKKEQLALVGITEDYVKSLGLSENVLTNTAEINGDLVDKERDKASTAAQNIGQNNKILKQLATQKTRLEQQAEALGHAQKMAHDLYDAFKGLATALGADENSPAFIFADMGMSMLDTVLNTIMLQIQLNAATIAAQGLGVAMNAAMGIIGWIVMAIQLLVTAITAAVNYAEKLRQMKLDILAGQVDNLKKKFDALADSIDEAWSIKQLKEYEKELDKLQKKMKDAQKDYIKLLESGKDGDTIKLAKQAQAKLDQGVSVDDLSKKERKALLSEEYEDYKNATEALAEMEEDYADKKREFLESVGGITDPHDAASEFVDAWLDAYKETGDGLSGLEENFDEFFESLIKKKAARMLSDTLLTKWIDTVNGALAEDSEGGRDLTDSEIAGIKAAQEKAKGDINNLLKGLFEGLDIGTQGNGSLSELQKGIQGITEDTAQIIESYLNSIRGYVSEQVTYTKRIYEMFDRMSRGNTYGLNVRMIS